MTAARGFREAGSAAATPPRHRASVRSIPHPLGILGFMALAVTLSFVACGSKASPRPPQFVRPEAIDDLTARPVADGIRLTWTRPTKTTDGSDMPDLDGIMISRAAEAPTPADARDPTYDHIATIHLDDRARFDKVRKMTFDDRTVAEGHTYVYRVRAFTLDGYFGVWSPAARAQWPGPPQAAKPNE